MQEQEGSVNISIPEELFVMDGEDCVANNCGEQHNHVQERKSTRRNLFHNIGGPPESALQSMLQNKKFNLLLSRRKAIEQKRQMNSSNKSTSSVFNFTLIDARTRVSCKW